MDERSFQDVPPVLSSLRILHLQESVRKFTSHWPWLHSFKMLMSSLKSPQSKCDRRKCNLTDIRVPRWWKP